VGDRIAEEVLLETYGEEWRVLRVVDSCKLVFSADPPPKQACDIEFAGLSAGDVLFEGWSEALANCLSSSGCVNGSSE